MSWVRKTLGWLALLALAPSAGAQLSPGVLAVLLGGKPQLPSGQAFRYFANETHNLKSDTAGTTPITGAGDTVGAWFDGTGNGYNTFAAADAARPLYQVRSGKPYVVGDGVDDLLTSSTAPSLLGSAGSSPFTICMAYRWPSPAGSTSAVDESDSASTASVGSYFRTPSATPADMLASLRGSDGGTNIVTGTFITSANSSADHVACWVRNGSTLTPYLDGIASSNITVTTTNITLNRLNLFGRYRSATKDSWSVVEIYGVVAWKSDQRAHIGKITSILRGLYP